MFELKDCALVPIATGAKAATLGELRDALRTVSPHAIYYHFWGGLLEARFEEREYNNDFAAWVRHGLHDGALAERLAMVDPSQYHDLEDLRRELLDLVDERLAETERLSWVRSPRQLELVRSQIVVFDTDKRFGNAAELGAAIPAVAPSSLFYHFIDARRRTPAQVDDFREWLGGLPGDHADLCDDLAGIDPYFGTLVELRDSIAAAFARHTRTRQ